MSQSQSKQGERERLVEVAKSALNVHDWTYLPKRDGLVIDGILRYLETGPAKLGEGRA